MVRYSISPSTRLERERMPLVSRDVVYEKVESRAAGADGCEP
jgi:hypothetical protein